MGQRPRDYRRIGRKALASGRTLALLEARNPTPKSAKKWRYTFSWWHAAAPLAVLILIGGIFGFNAYSHAQDVARQKAAAAAQNAHDRSVSAQNEACRQAKVKQNADKVATMTYDQLYAGNCDD